MLGEACQIVPHINQGGCNPLGRESFGVTWEPSGLANVGQSEEKHDDTLQTDSSSTVRLSSVPEGVDVGFDILHTDSPCLGTFFNQVGIVHTLSSRKNLLAPDKKVITVGQLRILPIKTISDESVRNTSKTIHRLTKRGLFVPLDRALCKRGGSPADTCP